MVGGHYQWAARLSQSHAFMMLTVLLALASRFTVEDPTSSLVGLKSCRCSF